MCHWQRWPHIAAALIALLVAPLLQKGAKLIAAIIVALAALGGLGARISARILAWIVVLLIVASGLIGAYQTGMQIGLLPGPQACTVSHPFVMGSNDIPAVQCNVVTWSLFGLSLAAYNAIVSFLVAATAAFLLVKRR